MSPDNLRAIGGALFGPRWQRELARALSISERLMRMWLAGDRRLPANLVDRLDVITINRITELVAIRRELQRWSRKAA